MIWLIKTGPLLLSLIQHRFISKILLQTLTTALIIHAVMVDRVKMVSTVTPVTALEDILEITVKKVNCGPYYNLLFMPQSA